MAHSSSKKRVPVEKPQVLETKVLSWGMLMRATLIALACGWVFSPAFHGDWIGDDALYIGSNPILREPHRLWKAWFEVGSFIEYYPLHESFQYLQWLLFGSKTLGYHLTNAILHFISCLLIWRLLSKFGLRLAWLGGLIFAVHPMVVESVSLINEFKNTLSLPFFLLAMCSFFDYEEKHKRSDYLWTLGFFLLAMLSKITMSPFPVVMLLYVWWKRGRIDWDDIKATAPFFLIALTLGFMTIYASTVYAASKHLPPEQGSAPDLISRFALTGGTLAFYFSHVFAPVLPLPIYPQWSIHPITFNHLVPWLLFTGGFYWLWKKRASWGRHVLLGLGFFIIMLMPFLGLKWISYMNYTWAMDHFLYIPMIGLIGLIVAALGQAQKNLPKKFHPLGGIVIAGVIALLAAESHAYAGMFVDELTLSQYTVDRFPGAWLTRHNLAVNLLKINRPAEAIEQLKQALIYRPDTRGAHSLLGYAYLSLNETQKALAEDTIELQLQPGLAESHNNMGNALLKAGRTTEAIAEYQQGLKLSPDFVDAHNNLANALMEAGRLEDAIAEYRTAIKLEPGHSDFSDYSAVHLNLGIALLQSGNGDEAISQFRQAIALNSKEIGAYVNLGLALSLTGHVDEGMAAYQQALKIEPDNSGIYYNMGNTLLQVGRATEAVDQYQQALRLSPTNAEAHNNLGAAFLKLGKNSEAKAEFQEALRINPNYSDARNNLAHAPAH